MAYLNSERRPHQVIVELDDRGEIDRHAAMCLRYSIEGALAGGARAIVVDLRDLTSIDGPVLALLVRAHAACRAGGVDVGLLISGCANHAAIARALDSVGLGNHLQVASGPPAPGQTRPQRIGRTLTSRR